MLETWELLLLPWHRVKLWPVSSHFGPETPLLGPNQKRQWCLGRYQPMEAAPWSDGSAPNPKRRDSIPTHLGCGCLGTELEDTPTNLFSAPWREVSMQETGSHRYYWPAKKNESKTRPWLEESQWRHEDNNSMKTWRQILDCERKERSGDWVKGDVGWGTFVSVHRKAWESSPPVSRGWTL